MSYKLDYVEEISGVLSRLRHEHKEIGQQLQRIAAICHNGRGNLNVAISLLNTIKTPLLRHAVEEEARLGRKIMQSDEAKLMAFESIKILQEHRRIKEFFDEELPYLPYENSDSKSKTKIIEFVDLITNHHAQEEKEVFPLALNAGNLQRGTSRPFHSLAVAHQARDNI